MFKKALELFFEIPRIYKRAISITIDSCMMFFALACALLIRDEIVQWLTMQLYFSLSITTLVTLLIWTRLGLYRAVIRFIDIKALSTIFWGALLSGLLLVATSYFFKAHLPRSVPFIYTALLLIFVGGSRLMIRGLINAQNGKDKSPVIIYGAGSAGRQLALSLQHGAEYRVVGFVDDKKSQRKVSVAGLRVFPPNKLDELVTKNGVHKILLAMPSVAMQQQKKLLSQLQHLAVEVLTIPGSADLLSGNLQIDTLRKIDIIELLDRESVKPIDSLFHRCIENKQVMVTGAGGSIGSELCRQIIAQNPIGLVLFESSELALYHIEKELKEQLAKADRSIDIVAILASVQDSGTVESVIKRFAVNTIYHAAAYKHVPLVEHNVISGLRNNVWGTLNCAQVALACQVENFVLISTDKAVRPTNVMGSSKRLAELVLQALAAKSYSDKSKANKNKTKPLKTHFSMVRFGNVLDSSGSVVPLFKRQISDGGPVTVTHREITRYFMTIPEAAQLVIQAGAMGKGGEVYVLDMGQPVKIDDLAKKMIHLSGLSIKDEDNPDGDIEIVYTGLRPGEKLYEELLIGGDVEGTEHQRIMKAKEKSIDWHDLKAVLNQLNTAMTAGDIAKIKKILLASPLGYQPSSEIADHLWLHRGSEQPMIDITEAAALRLVKT